MGNLYGGALVSEHLTNQGSLKIQENQKEIHEPSPNKKKDCSSIPKYPVSMSTLIVDTPFSREVPCLRLVTYQKNLSLIRWRKILFNADLSTIAGILFA